MARAQSILVSLLLLSIASIGQSQLDSPVPCRSQLANGQYTTPDKTASGNNWEHITNVQSTDALARDRDCSDKCKTYCVEERAEGGDSWPGCVAFSSYVNRSGKCWCYGWDHKPTWYASEGYRSGWCMAYIRRYG